MSDERIRRYNRWLAIASWIIAASIFFTQVWVLLDSDADTVRELFPDWPRDPAYDGYLRGVAWGDILFSQPLFFLAGIGLWRMRRWGWIAGIGVGCVAIYFAIIQVSAELYIGGDYRLYGAGVFGKPFENTAFAPIMEYIALLPFAVFPAFLGIYSALQLLRENERL